MPQPGLTSHYLFSGKRFLSYILKTLYLRKNVPSRFHDQANIPCSSIGPLWTLTIGPSGPLQKTLKVPELAIRNCPAWRGMIEHGFLESLTRTLYLPEEDVETVCLLSDVLVMGSCGPPLNVLQDWHRQHHVNHPRYLESYRQYLKFYESVERPNDRMRQAALVELRFWAERFVKLYVAMDKWVQSSFLQN